MVNANGLRMFMVYGGMIDINSGEWVVNGGAGG